MVSNNPMFNKNYVNNDPSMQAGIDTQTMGVTVDNSYLANRAKASEGADPRIQAAGTLGSWLLINTLMDRYDKRACGAYEKSSVGRIGVIGDKIAKSAVAKPFVWVGNKINGGWNWLADHNKVFYALKNHRTDAEWNFAKVGGNGLTGFMSGDLSQLLEKNFLSPAKYAQQLERLGVSQTEIDAVKQTLKGMPKANRAEFLAREELKALGITAPSASTIEELHKMIKDNKILKLGFRDTAEFELLMKDTFANMDKIQAALKNADKNIMFTYNSNGTGWFKKLSYKLFGRNVSIEALNNKLSATIKNGNATGLGKVLAKSKAFFLEGMTNRFAGGKLMVLMQAFIFGDMIANVAKAEKGEKFKTGMERLVNDFSYFLAMPLGYWAMHKVGGLSHLGMTKDEVKVFKERLAKFKADYKAGLYKGRKAEFKAERQALKNMRKAGVKGPRVILKKIGDFIQLGNERIPSFRLNGCRNFLKNCVGVPMRIAIPLAVISPFVAKKLTQGEHKIFGRPKHSVLDDEPTETSENNDVSFGQQTKPQSDTNLFNMKKNGETYKAPDAQTHNKSNQQQTENAEQNEEVNSNGETMEPVRTYIPSPEGVKLNAQDTSKFDAAMRMAEQAEKMALNTLSGGF